jgi:hypothetical protein
MPDSGHKQTERRTRDRVSPETNEAGKSRRSDKPTSERKKDDLSSFEKAKKAFFNKLWQAVPRPLRLPLVALILLGSGLVASRSFWYPAMNAWVYPPAQRFAVGGRVLVEKDKGLPNADVQLLNQKQEVVSNATTDGAGYVTFNISTEDEITSLRCKDQNGNWASFFFHPKMAAAGKSFRVLLDQKRMDYDEQ